MTDKTLSEPASRALKQATRVLDELHEANVEVSRALAPLPLQDTLQTTDCRDRIIMAGLAVIRAVGLHVELAVLLGKLEAASD
jgi:hypothetical protein